MYSDAYITDIESDDTDVVWSYSYDNADDESDDESDDSVSTVVRPLGYSRERVYEFGEFEDNFGWVQCPSKSYRDRQYFHNMHSNCNTWYRPVSSNINIPSISLEKMNDMDETRMSDLELMSVSDDEERSLPGKMYDRNKSSTNKYLNILARWYCVPQMNLTFDTEDNYSELSDTFASEHLDNTERIDMDNENNNDYSGDNDDDSQTKYLAFSIENFLETEILVNEGEVNTECLQKVKDDDDASITSFSSVSTVPRHVVFGPPRLKKISFKQQVVKWKGTRAPKQQGPRKIICEMHGVRTISYDLPDADEVRPEAGVKSTRLSDNDSDDESLLSLQLNVRKNTSYESNSRDFTKDLHQPLLSDSSSSPSSRSGKSSSSSSSSQSSSSSTCSTCSTCSRSCTSSE